MNKLIAWLTVFRVGKMVADPLKWKRRQITATMLVPLIMAVLDLSRAYGVEVPLDHDQIVTLSTLLLIAINVILTLATSAIIGITEAADSDGVDEESPPSGVTRP